MKGTEKAQIHQESIKSMHCKCNHWRKADLCYLACGQEILHKNPQTITEMINFIKILYGTLSISCQKKDKYFWMTLDFIDKKMVKIFMDDDTQDHQCFPRCYFSISLDISLLASIQNQTWQCLQTIILGPGTFISLLHGLLVIYAYMGLP